MVGEAIAVAHSFDRNQSEDEPALIQGACANPAAFGPLYERYRDRIYWYLRTRTSSAEDAADLVQQVFLQAMDRLPQYNPKKGPFIGWLFGIARHASSNYHRGRRTTISWDLLPEVLREAPQDDLDSHVLHEESLAQLVAVFHTLDRSRRELLVLRFVAGLSMAEIGAVIGKSEGATKKQMSRTLQALKEQYHDHV